MSEGCEVLLYVESNVHTPCATSQLTNVAMCHSLSTGFPDFENTPSLDFVQRMQTVNPAFQSGDPCLGIRPVKLLASAPYFSPAISTPVENLS
jgi:hypothetical protein